MYPIIKSATQKKDRVAIARCVFVGQKPLPTSKVGIHLLASEVGQLKPDYAMEKKLYRGGRPELPEEERSDWKVTVRFNKEEYVKLKGRKDATNAKDLSAFIRDVCLRKPIPLKTQLSTYQAEALSLLVEMRADILRIGVNINQSTKRINSTTDYRDLQRDISQMASNMNRIDEQLQQLFTSLQGNFHPPLTSHDGCPDQ